MTDKKKDNSSINHLVSTWGKMTAIIASLTGVAVFLANMFGWEDSITLSVVALVAIILIITAAMIDRVSRNQTEHDIEQDTKIDIITKSMDERLCKIEALAHEGLCSSLRTEMNSAMRHQPENHDLIMMYAERYFNTLGANWSETAIFMNWVDKENAAGRPINIPPQLFQNIEKARMHEKSN